MKVELTIDRTKEFPKGALSVLEKELLKRLNNQYENCSLVIRRTGLDSLSVFGGNKDDKKNIESILQETWESADDWFY
ncbi:TPA: DinI-like family protein [Citrobacter amalonaticus]|uniref:DinI-like family protein n=1 Tax=Citrobacter sp. CtB7.12 TaxID=1696093 RepID=UPI0006BA4F19|nr:DinI-like family protein [Citrobacter sp. CtB7.12]HEM7434596.1 DinI-like family protein [Citrobacter amalonaticus]